MPPEEKKKKLPLKLSRVALIAIVAAALATYEEGIERAPRAHRDILEAQAEACKRIRRRFETLDADPDVEVAIYALHQQRSDLGGADATRRQATFDAADEIEADIMDAAKERRAEEDAPAAKSPKKGGGEPKGGDAKSGDAKGGDAKGDPAASTGGGATAPK